MRRRRFLESSLGLLACAASHPLAATGQTDKFSSNDFQQSFAQLFAGQSIVESQAITLSLPAIAENGAVVPITISSELDDIERLSLWVEKNPTPLIATYEWSAALTLHLTARIRMAESSQVIVMAKQGQQWLRCQQWVQVMQGGCGTG